MIYFVYVLAVVIIATMLLQGLAQYGSGGKNLVMSDEEFLRRCPDGVKPEIALRVRRIISEQLNIPYQEIHPEHRFVEDLKAD